MSAEIKIVIDSYANSESILQSNVAIERMLVLLKQVDKYKDALNKAVGIKDVLKATEQLGKLQQQTEKLKQEAVKLQVEEEKLAAIRQKNSQTAIVGEEKIAQAKNVTTVSTVKAEQALKSQAAATEKVNQKLKQQEGLLGGLKQSITRLNALKLQATTPAQIARVNTMIDSQKKKMVELGNTGKEQFNTFGNAAKSFQFKFNFLGNLVATAALSIASSIKHSIGDSINSFMEAEKNAKQLGLALKNVSGEGDVSLQLLLEQSEELQKKGIFSDDAIQQAQAQLANYGLTSSAIEKLIPQITDMAAATGKDLGDATSIVIKGINGQTKGLKMLGIDYKDTGDKAKNLGLLTDQLTKFQGANEAQLETTIGTTQRWANIWDDVKEGIGGFLVGVGQGLLDWYDILSGKQSMSGVMSARIQDEATTTAAENVSAFVKTLKGTAEEQSKTIDSEMKRQALRLVFANKLYAKANSDTERMVYEAQAKIAKASMQDLIDYKKDINKKNQYDAQQEADEAATLAKDAADKYKAARQTDLENLAKLIKDNRSRELAENQIAYQKEIDQATENGTNKLYIEEIYNRKNADINKKYDDEELAAKEKHYQDLYDAEVLHQQSILDAKLDVQTRTKKLESDIAPEQTDFEKEMDRYRKQGQELNDLADQAQEQGIFDQARYDEDLQKLEDKHQLELKKIKNEADKQAKEDRKTSQNAQIDEVTQFLDTIAGLEQKRSDDKIAQINRQITAQDEAITQQEIRAAQGLSNTLAFEEDKRRQLEMAAIQEEKRQEKLKKLEAFYNLFSEFAKTDPDSAALKAAEQVFVAEGLSLAFAEKGGIGEDIRDTTSLINGQFDKSHGSGDMLTMISPKEGILTEQNVAALGGKDGFYNLKSMLENPIPDDIFARQNDSFANSFITTPLVNLDPMLKKLESLENAVKNIQTTEWNVDGFGNLIHTKTSQNSRIITNKGIFIKPARKKTID